MFSHSTGHCRFAFRSLAGLFVIALLHSVAGGVREARAELMLAISETSSSHLSASVDHVDSLYDRLMSWTGFEVVNVASGTRLEVLHPVRDPFGSDHDFAKGFVSKVYGMVPFSASNSFDSAGSQAGGVGVSLAVLTPDSLFPEPILLSYGRGSAFIYVPDPPASGLFRPPRPATIS